MVLGHAQAIQGDEGLALGKTRDGLRHHGEGINGHARNAQARGPAAHQAGDFPQHAGKGHVLAAQDIEFTDPAALERGQMTGGHIVHMHQIEGGIHITRHPPARRLHDDPPSGRRLDVARADGGGGIDNHRRQSSLGRHGLDQPLGCDLTLLIGADRAGFVQRAALVGGRPIGARRQRRHAAGVYDPFDPMTQRRFHHDSRSVQIVLYDLIVIGRPEPVIGGHMEQHTRFRHRTIDGRRIPKITLGQLDIQAGNIVARAAGAHQGTDPAARPDQRADDGGPHEAGSPGDQNSLCHAHPIIVPGLVVRLSRFPPSDRVMHRFQPSEDIGAGRR